MLFGWRMPACGNPAEPSPPKQWTIQGQRRHGCPANRCEPSDPHAVINPGKVLLPDLPARMKEGNHLAGNGVNLGHPIALQRITLPASRPEVCPAGLAASRHWHEVLDLKRCAGNLFTGKAIATAPTGIGEDLISEVLSNPRPTHARARRSRTSIPRWANRAIASARRAMT